MLTSNSPGALTAHAVPKAPRVDLVVVANMVEPGSRVLDVGCGDGELLQLLSETRDVGGRGIEISRDGVILSQTLQATRRPRWVLEQMLRIGKRVIVSFPNFGHWRIRGQLVWYGRMPVTRNLPVSWYDTPNIHFCTIRDFVDLTRELEVKIERAVAFGPSGVRVRFDAPWWFWNLFGEQAVFLLSMKR